MIETTQIMIETTQIMVETTQIMIETTQIMIETTQIMIETTQIMIETTQIAIDAIILEHFADFLGKFSKPRHDFLNSEHLKKNFDPWPLLIFYLSIYLQDLQEMLFERKILEKSFLQKYDVFLFNLLKFRCFSSVNRIIKPLGWIIFITYFKRLRENLSKEF